MSAKVSGETVEQLRAQFHVAADEAFDAMFGGGGGQDLVTFDQRERQACEQTDRLARWLLEKHLLVDPAGAPPVEVACPLCGHPVGYESAEQAEQEVRELTSRRGKIEYQRAARRCRRCRTIFFPAGREVEAGDRGFQSGDGGQDRVCRGEPSVL